MVWTEIARPEYRRDGLRCAGHDQWGMRSHWAGNGHGGDRPRETPLCQVVNAIFYIAQSGCPWRMFPKGFPPFTAVQY